MTLQTLERRALGSVVELRADPAISSSGRMIVGYAAIFNSATLICQDFEEVIAPGAFAAAIGRDDVRALIDHDPSLILGRTTAGTLRLAEDAKGLRCEIDTPSTSVAADLLISMDRGDVTQMSFAFRAVRQSWDETLPVIRRTIEEVELFDVSVVTYPAYPDTEAEACAKRSLMDWRSARPMVPAANSVRRLKIKRDLLTRIPLRA